jgi:hypothetical protein
MAADTPAKGSSPAKAKPLSLRSPWTWVIIGGIALIGGAYLLWRNSQSSSSSSTGSTGTTGTNDAAELGTLQDEIGNLQSSAGSGSGGGTSVVPIGDTSGSAGTTTTTGTGPATGGNSTGAPAVGSTAPATSGGTSPNGAVTTSSGSSAPSGTPGSWTDTGQTWTANQLAAKLGIPESALRGSNRLGDKALGNPNAPIAKGAAFTFLKSA